MKIGNIPYNNAFKLEAYDPQNSIIKKLNSGGASENTAVDPNYGRFDIFLKSGDNIRGEVVSEYKANILKETFAGAEDNFHQINERFDNLKNQLREEYSNGNFSTAEYDEICSFLDETNRTEAIARMKSSLGQMGNSQIAAHVGGIGKYIDQAYAEGRFSRATYDELNAGFNEYAVKFAEKCKRAEASWIVFQEEYLSRSTNPGLLNKSFEDIQADRQEMLDAYLEKNPIDIDLILKMINSVRYGK